MNDNEKQDFLAKARILVTDTGQAAWGRYHEQKGTPGIAAASTSSVA